MDARQIAAGMTMLANEDVAVQAGRLRGERRRRIRQARHHLDATYESIAERNAALAAACGACTCFGAPDCLDCGGEGKPGWQRPDESLFRQYVAPVLEQLGVHLEDEAPHHASLRALSWADASAQSASL
ncbi:MAG TPA: hypothetical protein VFZ09_31880 [Archangium sp.]|uniref:hypothetical protein n=1 Tax=Archangium sp. TaxID=1872627 RepID=UPI002E31D522|nr:hypothetical protein [Archangium sp.]HEX5750868.1 hypothetical protein [Archangium sp.]